MPNELTQTNATAHERLKALRAAYSSDTNNQTFNCLLYGDSGTGKTRSLRTCVKPVLTHVFDPGGEKTNLDQIREGSIIADTQFQQENKDRPDLFIKWEKEVMALKKAGVFDTIGTYAIDSFTLWFEALMKAILVKERIEQLRIQDWGTIYNVTRDWVNWLCALPCNVVLIGHIDIDKDEVTGRNETTFLLAGSIKRKLPIFFDEMYVTTAKTSSTGTDYKFLTRSDGYYKAKTRLGGDGKLDKLEEPDFKKILKKIGLPFEDKEF